MPKTQADLVNRALALLAVFGEGETPSDDDIERVNKLVAPSLAMLSSENVTQINNPEAIEDDVFLPLARFLANEAAPEFSRPYSDDARALAVMQINRVVAVKVHAQPLATDYF